MSVILKANKLSQYSYYLMKLCLYICLFCFVSPQWVYLYFILLCLCLLFKLLSVSLFLLIFDYLIVLSPYTHTLNFHSFPQPPCLPSFWSPPSHTLSPSLSPFLLFVVSFLLLQISILNVHTRPTLLEIEKHILLNIEKYL